MSKSEPDAKWACQVGIRFEVDVEGNAVKRTRTVDFGPVMHEPSEVTNMIRRAQLAALSPDCDYAQYLTCADPMTTKTSTSFSRNVVILSISGPSVTDLSIVDLPVREFAVTFARA